MKRHFSLRGATSGPFRLETLEGREHVVVPVVALVEGVIHASNSAAPELVLAEEFSRTMMSWNDRPVMFNHPVVNGETVSANDPIVLEKWRIGRVFHTGIQDKKLLMEAWLDPNRAAVVDSKAVKLLDDVRAGKVVEVSVGVFVASEERIGEFNGQRYAGIWRDIIADHLAMLEEGAIGACSVEMGCGAPRAAAKKEDDTMTLKEKFLAMMEKFKSAQEGMADSDVRGALDRALFATEPAYLGLVEVFPEDKLVIYAVAPDGQEKFLERSFEIASDQSVTFGSEVTEVKMVTKFEPVTASAASCGCGGQTKLNPASAETKETDMERKKVIEALVASKKQCFSAEQLEKFDDAALATLEAHVKAATETTPPPAVTPPATPVVEEKKEPAKDEPLTEEKVLAAFPRLKQIVEASETRAAAQKKALVTRLKDAAKGFSEPELTAMSIETLEKMAKSFDVKAPVDFSLNAPEPRAASDGDETVPDPPSMRDAILASRVARKGN
jgi:hypothetical protein